MRILYGVVGEGMGHAIRSRVVLEHLFQQGHEVEIIASGRAVQFLSEHASFSEGGGVHRIQGLHMIYEENRVRRGKTLWSNVLKGTAGLPGNIATYFESIAAFRPGLVISDFESWSYLYAKLHNIPVISIDNMQILNRCELPRELLEAHRQDFEIARTFVKGKLPFCNHYLITTFFRPPIRKPDTTLYPPILRPEILNAVPTKGDHVLVYQTAEGHESLTRILGETGHEYRIYGMRRDLEDEEVEGNLRYRPFSEAGFVEDLASARAVIAGGGFTLMGEAVYLHKPMLAVPLAGQFEQVLNSRYLEHMGYGRYASHIDDEDTLRSFLEQLPEYEDALSAYSQDGNRELLDGVDMHIDRAEAGVY